MTKAIVKAIHAVLLPAGFCRQGTTWTRVSAALIDVIEIQVSKAGDAVTVNVGVLDPDIYALCWPEVSPAKPDSASCTVAGRIGELMEDRDLWWDLENDATPLAVSQAVERFALPFLARLHDPSEMEDWLVSRKVARQRYPPPIVHLAILMARRGDVVGARGLLDALAARLTGAWRSRVERVAVRIERMGTQASGPQAVDEKRR